MRLQNLWLKHSIELASQFEQQPLFPDLRPQMTPPKTLISREESKTRQKLAKLGTNTYRNMTYLFGLYFDDRKYMTMKKVYHRTLSSASSKATYKYIFECLAAQGVDLDIVEVD